MIVVQFALRPYEAHGGGIGKVRWWMVVARVQQRCGGVALRRVDLITLFPNGHHPKNIASYTVKLNCSLSRQRHRMNGYKECHVSGAAFYSSGIERSYRRSVHCALLCRSAGEYMAADAAITGG